MRGLRRVAISDVQAQVSQLQRFFCARNSLPLQVGFGSAQGTTANADGMSIYMRFDEEALKSIALATGAEYFHAGSGADLKRVYETLNARYVLEKKETEVSALLSALAALLIMIAAALSVLWFGRIGGGGTSTRDSGGTRQG